MKYDKYIDLIKRLEASAKADRRAYERRVFGLTVLGYGYIVGLIVLLLFFPALILVALLLAPERILAIGLQLVKIWFIVIPGLAIYFGILGAAARSLLAKLEPPEGIEITASDAPELFEFLARASKELEAQIPDKVLINDQFNAAVVTVPKFGIFGRRVYLLLGVPLMKALSPEQFEAVVAHEMGHISGKHGAYSKWAYQMRESWQRLIESQETSDRSIEFLFKRFANWFFPYFGAYSFILMREHEIEADASAAAMVGAKPLAESLLILEVKGTDINDGFWSELHKESLVSAEPPRSTFTKMLGSMAFHDEAKIRDTITRAMAVPTDYNDPHPSLAERLRLMGYADGTSSVILPEPAAVSSADRFLHGPLDDIVKGFDARWDDMVAQDWKQRHQHFQGLQKRLAEINEKAAGDGITAEEWAEKIQIVTDVDGFKASIPIAREAVEQFPDDANLNYVYGALLLTESDEAGIDHLQKAVELDRNFAYGANDTIFGYLTSKGRFDEAKHYANIVETEGEEWEKANAERSGIWATDRFELHELDDEVVTEIKEKLADFKEITAAYLVKKIVKYKTDLAMHVLFIDQRSSAIGLNESDFEPERLLQAVIDKINSPKLAYYAITNGDFQQLQGHLRKIEGATIYRSS